MFRSELTFMQRALELAERGRGHVEPNPLVGAVIVRDGKIVGEGWHKRFGEAHAEINAIETAGERAHNAALFVTLEPCCHHGKTPPCTAAILKAGIKHVIAAMTDPFAEVSGKGLAELRAAGVTVDVGLGEAEAQRLNAPYLKLIQTGRPYVHAKWAMSLDGKIATHTGDSKWISGEQARRRVHELRGRMDAIIVGVGTVLSDDPSLTARPAGPRTATRIVLDSRGRFPIESALARTAKEVPVLLVTTTDTPADRLSAYVNLGCETLELPSDAGIGIKPLLDELGRRRMTNVLVEGGGATLGSFFDAGMIDEVHAYIAPRLIGGAQAVSPLAGRGIEHIADSLSLSEWATEVVGDCVLIHGRVSGHGNIANS